MSILKYTEIIIPIGTDFLEGDIMGLILLDYSRKNPLYIQLYQYYKTEIEQKRLLAGDKLPSIRSLAQSLSISKITVEKAYQQLMSEGYIDNNERARYVVNKLAGIAFASNRQPGTWPVNPAKPDSPNIIYDFSSGEMDLAGFDFSLWKRYINKVFLNKDRLFTYGDIQGEEELRQEIIKYLQNSRGVYANKDQVIIGPGVQSLLNYLCSVLQDKTQSVAFEDPGFKNGRRIFADHGFTIVPIKMKNDGIDMDQLYASEAKMVYLSPSHQFPTGYIMPVGKRNQLLNWAENSNSIIIEDDYDSEFRYFGRPIPALKGLDTRDRVVYMGSFSKVLPPSIRLSYMVLPMNLLAVYRENASLYHQATSTIEQLAMAGFMADGHFERQIRRLRKLYYEKKLLFIKNLHQVFGDKVEIKENESGLRIILNVKSNLSPNEMFLKAQAKGCKVALVQDYYLAAAPENLSQIILYFSKIPATKMKKALKILQEAWF
ncbi:MAG: transcriptional regulator, GntR family with aminotransferase domain containing protein [Firmicutes bacterium]|nr:transcriptional regulator, GntR family with aminotransferase domain containing protein [Bacillota bacterium]